MSPILAGALGAAALLLTLGAVRRLVWFRRLRRWRGGGRLPMRHLFARLGTRPDQEAVIAAEVEAFWREAASLRGEGPALRGELADLLASEALEAATVSTVLAARLEKLQALRARAAEALARIHAALDPEQRARAVALLRHGRRGWRHAHGRC
jgi:Spy/CpxP family protein refolding chaperone